MSRLLRVAVVLMMLAPLDVSSDATSYQINTACFDKDDLDKFSEAQQEKIIFRRRPIIGSYWVLAPDVRLCKSSGVTEVRLRRAMLYWTKLGYTFGHVLIEEEGSRICFAGGLTGEIAVLLVTSDTPIGDNLAITRNAIMKRTSEIVKVQIYINPYAAKKPLVLEHEIGHALGWLHYNRSYHIMNADYPRVGHSSTGVSQREHLSEIERITED